MSWVGSYGKNVEKEPFPCHAWTFRNASVQVLEPVEETLPASSEGGCLGTAPEGVTAELVDLGTGSKQEYEGKDVEGKLVLVTIDYDHSRGEHEIHYEAQLHGAVGVISHILYYQLIEDSLFCFDHQGFEGVTIPYAIVSHKSAAHLRELLEGDDPVVVTLKIDATIDLDGTGYNVVGYIPGTTHPDELIIFEGQYDKWWYGATDDSAGISSTIAIAEALNKSGYRPSRTLVFVAISAEEYGWTNTEYDWLIGSWNNIYIHHPDWAGRTRAFIYEPGGGTVNATQVTASGTPETYHWRSSLLPLFDEYFSTTEPWSDYYYPSRARYTGLPSTWDDQFPYAAKGIPIMQYSSGRVRPPLISAYHTNFDTMDRISAESLAMGVIATGIAAIRLDRSLILPFDFEKWADHLESRVDEEAIAAAGLSTGSIYAKIRKFKMEGAHVWNAITSTEECENADVVNSLLLETAKTVLSRLITVGGDDLWTTLYPHQQYQRDSMYLGNAIEALEEGDVDAALANLIWVTYIYYAVNLSYEVVRATIEREDLHHASGRLAVYTDVYQEYFSLLEKKAADNEDYSDEIASLQPKYEAAVDNLEDSLETITETLSTATGLLKAVKAQLT